MLRTSDRGQRRRTGFRRTLAAAVSSMIAIMICAGLVSRVGAGEPAAVPPYDRRVLSEIARNVVRGGAAAVNQSVGEPSLPGWGSEPAPDLHGAASQSEPDESLPIAHIAPPPTGSTAPMEPGSHAPQIVIRETEAAAGYDSNSWRQRTDTGRALSFSSGRLAPAVGLDPALTGHAHGLRAEGRAYVYGFLLLRVPVDEAFQKKLAGLDVELLGAARRHHKARLPMASLSTIAAMPEVEWVGLSAPWQKLSSELAAIRGLQGQPAVVASGDLDPDRRSTSSTATTTEPSGGG